MNDFNEFTSIPGFERGKIDLRPNSAEQLRTVKIPEDHRYFILAQSLLRKTIHIGHHNPQSDYTNDPDTMGIVGELAFEFLTGAPMDKSIKPAGDDFDFFINNLCIDVKATTGYKLYVKSRRLKDDYIYILGKTNVNTLTVVFCGWTVGKVVRNKGVFTNNRFEPSYHLYQSQLASMTTLESALNINFRV